MISKLEIQAHARPLLIFSGDVFNYNPKFIRIYNLFADFFYENVRSKFYSPEDIQHIIHVAADE